MKEPTTRIRLRNVPIDEGPKTCRLAGVANEPMWTRVRGKLVEIYAKPFAVSELCPGPCFRITERCVKQMLPEYSERTWVLVCPHVAEID